MTSEDSTLREVDQELAEERQVRLLRQFGPILAIGALAMVIGVAGWQFYASQKNAKAEKGAIAYQAALFSLEDNEALGSSELAAVATSQAPGYAALAALQRAPILARDGDTAQAYLMYRNVATMDGITQPLRDLARLRSAYLSLDVGGREAVINDLGTLPNQETPLGYYAQELLGLAAVAAKDYDAAIGVFDTLSNKAGAPAILQQRANEFAVIARAGKAGANISGEARVQDLLKTLGETIEPAPELLPDDADHDGHGHENDETVIPAAPFEPGNLPEPLPSDEQTP